MQKKPFTQTLATTEPVIRRERFYPTGGQGQGALTELPGQSEEPTLPGWWWRFVIRAIAAVSFLFYVILSQYDASSQSHTPSWWRGILLCFIGWYGWWETSLQMKESQRTQRPKPAKASVRRGGAPKITLIPQTPEHLRILLEGVDRYQHRFCVTVAEGVRDFLTGPEVSAEFLARLKKSAPPDPWRDGFAIIHNEDNTVIGLCGFTGPPGTDGAVEIAYGIAPGYQNRGLAGEAARELIAYALSSGQVRTVRAHTLPENNASTRVLARCGFTRTGEVTHPEDGVVWRWETAA